MQQELIFNPLDPAFKIDPVPTYRRLLDEAPRLEMTFSPGWVLSRHSDCLKVLEHKATSHDFRNSEAFLLMESSDFPFSEEFERRRSFLFMDPPDHTRLRSLVSKAFTRRRVEALRPRIEQLVHGLLDDAIERGGMELIEDFAYPVPVTIISEMLGVPPEDNKFFGAWSKELARSLDPDPLVDSETLARRDRAANDFRDYFSTLIERRRSSPGEDLISALIAVEEAGDKLTKDELLSTLILLLIAGHETTVNLIGNGVLSLMRHRDQWDKLKADPALARKTVEEVLRFDPPVLFTGRVPLEDIDLDGITLKKGCQLILMLGAANRDPEVFDEPDRFDINRSHNPHLAFGMGIHFCLGAPLARLEGEIALQELARRVPGLQMISDAPEYKENVVLRGLSSLPVEF